MCKAPVRLYESTWSVCIALRKISQTGGLSTTRLTILKAGKSKIKGPANSVPHEVPLSGSQKAVFSLHPPHQAKQVRKLSGVSLIESLTPFMRTAPS